MIRAHFFREKEKAVRIPVIFYSKAGKKRLIKIWNAQKLSENRLFAALTSSTNESAIRERVNDYMQAYLQACMRLQRSTARSAFEYIYQKNLDHEKQVAVGSKDETSKSHPVQSKILERMQNIAVLRDRFQEKFAQDEQKAGEPKTKSDTNVKQIERAEGKLAITHTHLETEGSPRIAVTSSESRPDSSFVDSSEVISHHCSRVGIGVGRDNKLVMPSRSSGFQDDDTISPPPPTSAAAILTSSPSSSVLDDDHDTDNDNDSLYDDFSEGTTIDSVLKRDLTSDDEQANCEERLRKALSNEIEFGWLSPLIAENVFKEKRIAEVSTAADRIFKCHYRELAFADEFSEKLEIFLKSKF